MFTEQKITITYIEYREYLAIILMIKYKVLYYYIIIVSLFIFVNN